MGVAGVGKTTVANAVARQLGVRFLDADDYHPATNIAKMRRGEPLSDTDREPWLDRLNHELHHELDQSRSAVLACSALKAAYRRRLTLDLTQPVRTVFLHADADTIRERMVARQHFMPAALLESQFDALEIPQDALSLDAGQPVEELVARCVDWIMPPATPAPRKGAD